MYWLEDWGLVRCGAGDLEAVEPSFIAGVRRNRFGCEVLVRNKRAVRAAHPKLVVDNATIEDIMVLFEKEVPYEG